MNSTAEAEVIKAAYAAMAKKYHPDRGGTTERMKEINEAYEVLSDAGRKTRYDVAYQERQKKSGATGGYYYQSGYYQRQRQSASDTASGSRWNGGFDRGYESQGQSEQRQQTTREPSGREKLLPWLSWKWQRIALFSSFPIALILMRVMHNPLATPIGLTLLVAASYACIKTRGLTRTRQASSGARFAGGLAIVLSLGGMVLAAMSISIPLAIPALLVFALLSRGRSSATN